VMHRIGQRRLISLTGEQLPCRHRLAPSLDAGTAQRPERDTPEGHGTIGDVHGTPGAGDPHLSAPALIVEVGEGDLAGLGSTYCPW
jgi:hypothetical protein